ncbi:hypothetical protein AB0I22_03895 [Streptomyces sp. NPDC050610]|uniref:hypothetical protein n=1 Tax=Streptomyces sp. NPDC050610 TaxID=3157097 RepID=UPI003412F761
MTGQTPERRPRQRKQVLLRLDPLVHDALARWAGDELRSTNAQIEFLLRKALADAGRLPGGTGALPRRGRPPKQDRGAGGEEEAPPPPAPGS